MVDLGDLNAFVAVARAGGFRDAARANGASPSGLSEAVRRLEARLGVRLLHRTTRSTVPTEAGRRLLDRLGPALAEMETALDAAHNDRGRPAGTLRLNVPVSAVRLEVIAEDGFADVLAAGCDAGIRYDERAEHPHDLLAHACLRRQFSSGAMAPLGVRARRRDRAGRFHRPLAGARRHRDRPRGGGRGAGDGVIHLFEGWPRPHLDSSALEPVLEP